MAWTLLLSFSKFRFQLKLTATFSTLLTHRQQTVRPHLLSLECDEPFRKETAFLRIRSVDADDATWLLVERQFVPFVLHSLKGTSGFVCHQLQLIILGIVQLESATMEPERVASWFEGTVLLENFEVGTNATTFECSMNALLQLSTMEKWLKRMLPIRAPY